jgi:hypothetical protein
VSSYHYVRPYRRRNGTLVHGYLRRNPRPRIGAGAVILFVLMLVILGGLANGHASGTSVRPSVGTTQQSSASPTDTP